MPFLDVEGNPVPTDTSVYDAVRVVSTRRTVLVRSSTQVVDVAEIGAETTRHGVFFLRYVPYQAFLDGNALVAVAPIGYQIDSALDIPGIGPAMFVQDVDDAGLLTNAIEFVVSVPAPTPEQGGPFTTTVTITIQEFYDSTDWPTKFYAAQQTILSNLG